ncbi:MAG: serine/threonine protein kinase [Pseudanabaenaceae cyanobacterium]
MTSLLGEGGFGKTYAGIDRETGRPVAIKTISLRQMQDWQSLDFFQREASILAQLDHPGIPKYITSFHEDTETDRTFYLVRELVVGESLANLIKQGWRAQEAEIRDITAQLLEILIYLHELNPPVIHRDIKPSNIIYQPDNGSVFLIDFGSVFLATGTVSGMGTFVGTYGYIAPEQLRGEASAKSDIYSVAMTVAFLLTGREPSELPRKALRLNLRSLKVNASAHLLEWIDRANAPIPEDRFTSAREALQKLQSQMHQKAQPPVGSKISTAIDDTKLEIHIPCYLQNSWQINIGSSFFGDGMSEDGRVLLNLFLFGGFLIVPLIPVIVPILIINFIEDWIAGIIARIIDWVTGGIITKITKDWKKPSETNGWIYISIDHKLLKVYEVVDNTLIRSLFRRKQPSAEKILEVSLDQVVIQKEAMYTSKLCRSIKINQIDKWGYQKTLMQILATSGESLYTRKDRTLHLKAAELGFLYRQLEQHTPKSIKS